MKILHIKDNLLHVYQNQTDRQPCYVELDCDDELLLADYDAEIGGAVPTEVWHGRARRYAIPLLMTGTVNALLDELAPLAQRVIAGYTREWNGNNLVGRLTDDAMNAEDEIAGIIQNYEDDLHWYEAGDWLTEIDLDLVRRLHAGETVDALADEYQGTGGEDDPILIGLESYLEELAEDVDDFRSVCPVCGHEWWHARNYFTSKCPVCPVEEVA